MNKPITFITCLFFILVRNFVIAQDELTAALTKDSKRDHRVIDVLSLDGKKSKVHIMPDYVRRVLKVSCLKDTISIVDYQGDVRGIHVLDNRFLQIDYDVRGGTGLSLGNTMLLCVQKSKLFRAFFAQKYVDVLLDLSEGEAHYSIKMKLSGENKKNYKLFVKVHDKRLTKLNPVGNYNYNGQIFLNFDPKLNVFYELKETLFQKYDTIIPSSGNKQKLDLDEYYPTIILGQESYYFIKNEWFIPSKPGELEAFH